MSKEKFIPGDLVRINQPFDEINKAVWQVHDLIYKDYEPEEIWYFLKPPGTGALVHRTTARIREKHLLAVGKNIADVNPDNMSKVVELVERAMNVTATKKDGIKEKKSPKEKVVVTKAPESGEPVEKRKRGRPPGSKNKKK
jgi:hypothetical protein